MKKIATTMELVLDKRTTRILASATPDGEVIYATRNAVTRAAAMAVFAKIRHACAGKVSQDEPAPCEFARKTVWPMDVVCRRVSVSVTLASKAQGALFATLCMESAQW